MLLLALLWVLLLLELLLLLLLEATPAPAHQAWGRVPAWVGV